MEAKNNFFGILRKFYRDFQEWAYRNEILVAATGFCIGIATKEVIEKLLKDIVKPLIEFIVRLVYIQLAIDMNTVSSSYIGFLIQTIGNSVWNVLEWIIIIIMAFFLLEYFLNRSIIGMKSVVKTEDTTDFVKAKTKAKENIVPSKSEIKELDKTEQIEEKAGAQIVKLAEQKIEDVAKQNDIKSNIEVFYSNIEPFTTENYYSSY
jgi:large conductance mechanosensitive channel